MPTSITPFTTTPSRANPATFSADMDTRLAQENSRITEMNLQSGENNVINANVNAKEATVVAKEALVSPHYTAIDTVAANATNINSVATTIVPNISEILLADTNAATATAAAATALSTANATSWVSGTSYLVNTSVISPITFQTYRCKVATSGTTDPSLDSTHWTKLGEILPAQTGNSGKFLTTNGTDASWGTLAEPATSDKLFAFYMPYYYYSANNYEVQTVSSTVSSSLTIGNTLYFTTNELVNATYKNICYKVNLLTNIVEATTAKTAVDQSKTKIHYDGTYIYLVYFTNSGVITVDKVDLNLNSIIGIPMPSGFMCVAISGIEFNVISDTNYLYTAYTHDTTVDITRLLRIKKDGTEVKYIDIAHNVYTMNQANVGICQNTTDLFFTASSGSTASTMIVKIDKSTFTVSSSLEYLGSMKANCVDNTYLYVFSGTTLHRIDISTMTLVASNLYSGFSTTGARLSGQYIYTADGIINTASLSAYDFTFGLAGTFGSVDISEHGDGSICHIMKNDKNIITITRPKSFIFGTAYYSNNNMFSFVPTLVNPTAGTTPTASSVMTVSAVTTVTPTLVSTLIVKANPLMSKITIIDQI